MVDVEDDRVVFVMSSVITVVVKDIFRETVHLRREVIDCSMVRGNRLQKRVNKPQK